MIRNQELDKWRDKGRKAAARKEGGRKANDDDSGRIEREEEQK